MKVTYVRSHMVQVSTAHFVAIPITFVTLSLLLLTLLLCALLLLLSLYDPIYPIRVCCVLRLLSLTRTHAVYTVRS